MRQYLSLIEDILLMGEERGDRTGVGTISLWKPNTLRFNLDAGFPLVTTKKVFFKGVIHELLWFLKGETNIKYLVDNGVHIWDEWADDRGNLGPIYGVQWRNWLERDVEAEYDDDHRLFHTPVVRVHDQIYRLIKSLKEDPYSRRHIVSAWNVGELDRMALQPCHMMFQCYVTNDGRLNLNMYQRSCDVMLGLPFNIASYALLTHMLAQVTDLKPGTLTIDLGDAHIYKNHLEQARLQMVREPLKLPELWIDPIVTDIDDFRYEDIELLNYSHHPHIKCEVAV